MLKYQQGISLIYLTVWVSIAGLVWYLADRVQHPNTINSIGQGHVVTLKRGPDGHYRSEALINGETVRVLVDTGATGVAMTQAIADKLHLVSQGTVTTQTANGESVAYLVRLNSVKLGGIEANDVAATIAPNLDGDVLLGMSFLGRMDVRLYQGRMTISDQPLAPN